MSESLEELDLFVDVMRSIAQEVEQTPDLVKPRRIPRASRASTRSALPATRSFAGSRKPGNSPQKPEQVAIRLGELQRSN